MQDMEKAIDRIDAAIAQNEKVLIYGDYDVDGTTAVSLVYSFFQKALR
jgi:single-stranded-DNA-specific exonuclease